MIIEDEELRQLYKTSSNEHIQKLESDLMILEKNPQDAGALEEFLREAHTLKGDSRMLGLDDIEGKTTINFEDQPLSITQLASLLQLPTVEQNSLEKNYLSCIVMEVGSDRFGIIVDDLVDQQDVVFKQQCKLLKRSPNIAGATILGSGSICMILNPTDLLHSVL